MKTNIRTAAVSAGLGLLVAAAVALPAITASGAEIDLTAIGNGPVAVTGDVGGTGYVDNNATHTSGTGVFDPFLTIQNTPYEQGYNTDGHTALYMDQTRPEWNTLLRVGDLAQINIQGGMYYGFILDANEPGASKSVISIDNIRVYTSSSDNTGSVGSDVTKLDQLGTLRWAMNNPNLVGTTYNNGQWVKLDANQNNLGMNANGGSGYADMVVYVPVSAFGNATANDYVWFYNLNGVKYSTDPDLASQAGYEEWRAIVGVTPTVPDGGFTLAMLGFAMTGLGMLRRKLA
jgi:hypothetical protein